MIRINSLSDLVKEFFKPTKSKFLLTVLLSILWAMPGFIDYSPNLFVLLLTLFYVFQTPILYLSSQLGLLLTNFGLDFSQVFVFTMMFYFLGLFIFSYFVSSLISFFTFLLKSSS